MTSATKRFANGEPKFESLQIPVIDLTGDSDESDDEESESKASQSSFVVPTRLVQVPLKLEDGQSPQKSTPAEGDQATNHSKPTLVQGQAISGLPSKSPFRNRPSWSISREPLVVSPSSPLTSTPSSNPAVPPAHVPHYSTNSNSARTSPSPSTGTPAFRVRHGPPLERSQVDSSGKGHPLKNAPNHSHAQKRPSPSVNIPPRHIYSKKEPPVSPNSRNIPQVFSDVTDRVVSPKAWSKHTPLTQIAKQLPKQAPTSSQNVSGKTSSKLEEELIRPIRRVQLKHGPYPNPRPQTPYQPPPHSPLRTPTSNVRVVIDNSHRNLLPGARARRSALVKELQKSTSVVTRSRASSIEAIIGRHGFSTFFPDDETRLIKLAQTKAKKVERGSITLDWGTPFIPPKSSTLSLDELCPPREQAREVLGSKFNEIRHPPVTFVNEFNGKQLDGKFEFITAYVEREGVAIVSQAANFGCECHGVCEPETCSCFNENDEEDDFGDITHHGKIVPYMARDDGLVVLRDEYMNGDKSEIIECNEFCGCGPACWNTVVQKGRTLPLEIFMTKNCGFGLRSPLPIVKGQFIELYLGELLTTKALEQRELAYEEEASSYVFSLDWFPEITSTYHVDGIHFGTATRFINHSCYPNCRNFTVMMNRSDERVYALAFFAIRDIPAMTELTFDYNPQESGKSYSIPAELDKDSRAVLCQCGAENCRRRLWPGGKKKRKGRGWAKN